MKKAFSLVVFIFFIMLASVENKVKANTCVEGLGTCDRCDERCKAKHGAKAQGNCSRFNLCTCAYTCGKAPPAPQPKVCYGGDGQCSGKCGKQCCNQNCAKKYPHGAGFCDSIGHTFLCKCQYPC